MDGSVLGDGDLLVDTRGSMVSVGGSDKTAETTKWVSDRECFDDVAEGTRGLESSER